MKRTVALCIVVLASMVAGCSDDDLTPVGSSSSSQSSASTAALAPRDLVSYDVNNLIDNGDAILQAVADSYADVGDPDLVGIAACAADFAIYPDDLADEATFSTRMRRVYHATNGIFEAWKRDQVINAYDPSKVVIPEFVNHTTKKSSKNRGSSMTIWHKAVGVIKNNFGSLIKMAPGVRPSLSSSYSFNWSGGRIAVELPKTLKGDGSVDVQVAGQVDQIQSEGGFTLASVNTALDEIGQKLDVFEKEMRFDFSDVTSKIGTVLDNLVTLRGDVNILLNNSTRALYGLSQIQSGLENLKSFIEIQINQENLDNAIINHKSFMQGYAQKTDYISASNYVWENTQVSYQGLISINTFVKCAMSIQTAANTSSDLSQGVMTDPGLASSASFSGDKYGVRIVGYSDASWERDSVYANSGYNGTAHQDILFDYANPKKEVPMSLGNFEYLVQMMEDNLRLNKVIFTGDALKTANANLATTYITTIQPVKQGVMATVKQMKSALAAHIAKLQAGSWDDGSPTGWGWGYDGYDVFKLVNGVPGYGASIYLTTGAFNGHTNNPTVIDDYIQKLISAYEYYFHDYLGLYLAKLMAYEVRLRAYL